MLQKDAAIWAAATIDRAQQTALGSSTSLIGLLKDDNRFMVEALLTRNGASASEAHTLIDRLMGLHEQGRKAGYLKQRIDIDFRLNVDGVSMMDLFDTDLARQYKTRGRQSAGHSAMARIGIGSKLDAELHKKTILDEQAALGHPIKSVGLRNWVDGIRHDDKALSTEDIDGVFGHFFDANLSGNISPWYGRVKKATHLALMSQNGIASLADAGSVMATIGVHSFMQKLSGEVKLALKDKASPIVDEMRYYGVGLPLDRIERMDRAYELDTTRLTQEGVAMQTADRYLDRGVHLQGYISGSNLVRTTLRNMALDGAVARLFEGLNGKVVSSRGEFSAARMADLGFTSEHLGRLRKYIPSVTFGPDGHATNISLKDWDVFDRQEFLRVMDRSLDRAVHKAGLGKATTCFIKTASPGL
jgi:hypothetical protein